MRFERSERILRPYTRLRYRAIAAFSFVGIPSPPLTIFGKCYFCAEKYADGIQALRHYRYEVDEKLGSLRKEPLHDWASHAADAFRTAGVMAVLQRLSERF